MCFMADSLLFPAQFSQLKNIYRLHKMANLTKSDTNPDISGEIVIELALHRTFETKSIT